MPGIWTEENVRKLLADYAQLQRVAMIIAKDVASTRGLYSHPGEPSEYRVQIDQSNIVEAKYWLRGDWAYFQFPLRYLWIGHDQVNSDIIREIAKERELKELQAAEFKAEQERKERAEYERLKAKFEVPVYKQRN